MLGESHSEVAARLSTQLERLRSADPFRVLDVTPQVDREGVRRAYLLLTKKFHPNRFALEPVQTRDVANEVFLLIRRAYDLLADDDKRKQWRDRVAPILPTPGATATIPAPGTRPPAGVVPGFAPSGTPSQSLRARAATAAGPPPPSQPPAALTAPSGTAPSGTAPPTTRPTARVATVPASPPPPGAARKPSGPTTGIGASAQEVQAMLEAARTRGQRFDEAVALLARGKYKQAREAFYKIAMEDPQGKRYRVQLHLAWGLEHMTDGKPAEAQRELERAVALDPECAEAKTALAKAQEQQKKPSGGILGKLFGR